MKFAKDENYELSNLNDNLQTMASDYIKKAVVVHDEINKANNFHQQELFMEKYDIYKNVINEIEDYRSILFHKNIANSQCLAYASQIKNTELLKNKILIELDFKQKFVIGLSPRQVSHEFYNQTMRSCLGSCTQKIY